MKYDLILKRKVYVMQTWIISFDRINRIGKINETDRSASEIRFAQLRKSLKYFPLVYRPHQCLSISGNGTNHERAIISRNLGSDGTARRAFEVRRKWFRGWLISHIESSAHTGMDLGGMRTDGRACGAGIEILRVARGKSLNTLENNELTD